MANAIRTVELIAWGLDGYRFRPADFEADKCDSARAVVALRVSDVAKNVLWEQAAESMSERLEAQRLRADLHVEMAGLDWSLGVVDLRGLQAFQRRLSFHPDAPAFEMPCACDWDGLMRVAFAPPHPVVCEIAHDAQSKTLVVQSSNPNLHLRVTGDSTTPIAVHAGSPFLEVAEYAGRWFLRDGYHRAYALLRANVFQVPAVVVRARTLAELGAIGPQFFPEPILLSQHAPRVTDFLDERLTTTYERPRTIKTLRISMHESIAPAPSTQIFGESL